MEKIIVEFKIKKVGQYKQWEKIESLKYTFNNEKEIAFFGNNLIDSNDNIKIVRWNFLNCSQGHYINNFERILSQTK